MNIPSELKYTYDHEWAKLDGNIILVGITDYAQGELGDVVFIELPKVGDTFAKGDTFGTIEAVKAVSDLISPVNGEVVEINEALEETPDVVNSDPYGDGWMVKIKIENDSEWQALLSADSYKNHIG